MRIELPESCASLPSACSTCETLPPAEEHAEVEDTAMSVSDAIICSQFGSFRLKLRLLTMRLVMKTGRLRVLAIGSPKRSATLPEVPTVAEAGVPGFDFDSWTGYLVPVGTPRELIVKLHADITRTLAAPEVRDKLVTLGFDLVGGTPEAFATLIRNDIARFGKLIKAAGIKAE